METKQTQTAEELQAQLLRKMHSMDLIRTAACVLVAVVVPRANSILTNADNTVNELSAVVDELQQVDFIAMSEGITELTRVGSESLTGATVELIKTMQQLQSIDFEALSESIENLNTVSAGMAKLFGKKR